MKSTQQQKSDNTKRRPTGSIELTAFFILWVIFTLLVIRFWFVTDDAFISFRYAHNWAYGDGIRFNLGNHIPVEGYSNFLWVALCAFLEYIGAEIKFWPLVTSFICGSVLLWMVFTTLRHRFELSLPISFIATLFLAISPPYALWSTSGLETMPFALLMFLTFERLVLRKEGIAPITAGILGLALALMRAEGIYWAILLAPLAMVSRHMSAQKYLRPIIIYLGILIFGYAIYWIWRYTYYEAFLPNTFYAKVSINTITIKRGIKYVITQHLTFLPLLLILPGLIPVFRRRRLAVGLPTAIMALGVVCYTIVVSGDFMAMGRLLIPGLPFTALLFAWLLDDLNRGSVVRRYSVSTVAVLFLITGLIPAWNIHPVPESIRQMFHFRHNLEYYHSEYTQWSIQKSHAEEWEIVGRALKSYAKPSDSIVLGAIGAMGYYSELYVYDKHGLTDRDVASRKSSGRLKSPGHDKKVEIEYFLDKNPAIVYTELITKSELAGYIDDCRGNELSDRYVADFIPISDVMGDEEPNYLFVVRRIEDGLTPEEAWMRVREALKTL